MKSLITKISQSETAVKKVFQMSKAPLSHMMTRLFNIYFIRLFYIEHAILVLAVFNQIVLSQLIRVLSAWQEADNEAH